MFCKVTYFNILSCYVLCCIVTQNTIRLKKGDKTTMKDMTYLDQKGTLNNKEVINL